MCTCFYWIVNHLDRILAFIAIVIAAIAMIDVRRLFKELEKRDKDTENTVRHAVLTELLSFTASFAAFSRAAQFIDFNEGQPDKQTAIAMLVSFRLEQLLAPPNITAEGLAHLRKSARDKMERASKEYAQMIISSGIGKLKHGWNLSEE
jgi:hypothetical protein